MAARVQLAWGGYVTIEMTVAQWTKIEKQKKSATIEGTIAALYEVACKTGFVVQMDEVDGMVRFTASNTLDVFEDGKKYSVQAGSPDMLEALLAIVEKFVTWTKMKPTEMPLVGRRSGRF